ncbi:MAG: hypothetical protein K1X71_04920 [Pirellulales bacterium]|nr:hypothetical protein [Pirellulales bacterium]
MSAIKLRTALVRCLLLGTVAALACDALAAPWDLISFKRIDANPERTYSLKDTNGPWMILAVTFSGDGAEKQARELVLEIRKRYKLPAYMHAMSIDLADAGTLGYDRNGQPRKMKYQSGEEISEIAVLVGDYPAVDDPQAQRDLDRIKELSPDCLKMKEGKQVSRPLAALRFMQKQIQSGFVDENRSAFIENVKAGRGPLGNAFVTTNPLLPREYFVPNGLDRETVQMNEGLKFSLLDCKKRYSVRVATFTGEVIIDPKKIKEIESGRQMTSKLVHAAEDAHDMVAALRAKGVEAYEFHDRYSSVVCVGSFDSIGNQLADGRTELHPAINQIMRQFGAQSAAPGATQANSVQTKSIKTHGREIPYDLQPMPVEIPRASIARQFEHVAERF